MSATRYPTIGALSGLPDVSIQCTSAETCTTVNLEALMGMNMQWNMSRASDAGPMPMGFSACHAQLHAQGSAVPQATTLLAPWLAEMPDSSCLQAASSAAQIYAHNTPCSEDNFLDSQWGALGHTSAFGCLHSGVTFMPNSIQANWSEAMQQQFGHLDPARDQYWADQTWATGQQVPNQLHGRFDSATQPRRPEVAPNWQPSLVDGGHSASSLQRLPPNPVSHVLDAVPKSWAASTGHSNASTSLGPCVVAASSSSSARESTCSRAPKLDQSSGIDQVHFLGYAQPKELVQAHDTLPMSFSQTSPAFDDTDASQLATDAHQDHARSVECPGSCPEQAPQDGALGKEIEDAVGKFLYGSDWLEEDDEEEEGEREEEEEEEKKKKKNEAEEKVNDGKDIDKDDGGRPSEQGKEKPASEYANKNQYLTDKFVLEEKRKLADDGIDATDLASTESCLTDPEHDIDALESSEANSPADPPSLHNGRRFRASLTQLQLKVPLQPTERQKIHDCIRASLRTFSKEAIRPTVRNLQKCAGSRGFKSRLCRA